MKGRYGLLKKPLPSPQGIDRILIFNPLPPPPLKGGVFSFCLLTSPLIVLRIIAFCI